MQKCPYCGCVGESRVLTIEEAERVPRGRRIGNVGPCDELYQCLVTRCGGVFVCNPVTNVTAMIDGPNLPFQLD